MPTTIHTIGYHGTLDTKANSIIEENRFIPSCKDTEWLGEGVYFFGYKQHAIVWANNESNKKLGSDPCVLSVDLDYNQSDLLDLDDPDQLQMLNDFILEYSSKIKSSKFAPKVKLTTEEKHQRWCLACNLYRKINSYIKLTSYTFHFKITYVGFLINQRQFCVNDHKVISNIRKEND